MVVRIPNESVCGKDLVPVESLPKHVLLRRPYRCREDERFKKLNDRTPRRPNTLYGNSQD